MRKRRVLGIEGKTLEAAEHLMEGAGEDAEAFITRLLKQEADRQEAARPRQPNPDFYSLGRDAEACCLAHRRLVRWMENPSWWYHAQGWPRSGECGPMRRDNAPLIFIHSGRPWFMNPPTEQRLWARGIYWRMVDRGKHAEQV